MAMMGHRATFTAVATLMLSVAVSAAATRTPRHQLSDSEARTVCTARCLKIFKSKVSGTIAASIAADPTLINRECGGARGPAESSAASAGDLLDRIAVTDCQACTFSCMHYAAPAGKYSIFRTCPSFCTTVEIDQGFEPRTCRLSCNSLESIRAGEFVVGDAPERPQPPRIRQVLMAEQPAGVNGTAPSATAILDWSTGYSDRSSLTPLGDPIVFLVQITVSNSKPKQLLPKSKPVWKSLAFTTLTSIRLDDLPINESYLFRVGAILPSGGIAYSAASDELVPSERLTSPRVYIERQAVRELREGNSRLVLCQSIGVVYCVDVLIQWRLAKWAERWPFSLQDYEIAWSELDTQSVAESARHSGKRLINNAQTDCTIIGLKPATSYRVTVTANILDEYAGNTISQLVKSRSSITVTTMPASLMQSGQQQMPIANGQPSQAHWGCSCKERPSPMLVPMMPYYEDGQLKMLLLWNSSVFDNKDSLNLKELVNKYSVRWSQRVCIETDAIQNETRQTIVFNTPMLTITGLHFSCHYSLKFSGLTSSNRVAFTWNSCFCTGSCKETQIKGSALPPCPFSEVAQTPQPPSRINVTVSDSIAQLTWSAPGYPPLRAIHGFRIRWGPREPEDVHPDVYSAGGLMPRMSNALALTNIVSSSERQLLLYALQPGTVYIVTLQTLSAFGDSRPAEQHFVASQSAEQLKTASDLWRGQTSKSEEKLVQKYIIGVSAGAAAPRGSFSAASLIFASAAIINFCL